MEPGIYFPVVKERSSAAVSSISGNVLYKTPAANLTNTLYGLSSGLLVQQGTGEPGRDAASLSIRGIGSFNYSSYAVFVDGFQTTDSYFQYLLPAEIESISILKDAAALAPFGMIGGNGILWIETKRGRIGKPKIQVQFRTGMQQLQHITKPLPSADYATLYNEAVSNDNGRIWSPVYSASDIAAYKNGGTNVDWQDATLKSSTPFTSTDLTFDGGGENARYFIMLGYVDNQGFYDVQNDDTHATRQLQQYNIRSNFDFNLFKIFEGKANLGGRIEDRRSPAFDGSSLWNNLESYPNNIYPVKNTDGTWTGTAIYPNNPVASIRELGYYSSHNRSVQANFSLKEKLDFITPGLYVSEAASFSNWTEGSYNVTRDYARYNTNGVNETTHEDRNYEISEDNAKNQWNRNQFQLTAGYNKQFGQHSIASAFDYLQSSYNVDANQNGSAGNQMKYNRQHVSGRIHYEYDNRYTGEVSFSYSGADDFAKGNRFGFYPAVSGAWILSNEAFLQQNPVVDFLKIRASIGKTGFNTFDGGQTVRYLYQQYYINSGSYLLGNSSPSSITGIIPYYIAMPGIFAEQSIKYNVGLDAQLFKGLDITADAFIDKRSGILYEDNSYLAVVGITPPIQNSGKVTTSGLELDLNYHGASGKFTYAIGGNLSYLKDKIDYIPELTPPSPAATRIGYSIGLPNGYESTGFYDISDFNSDGTLKDGIAVPSFGSVQPGDLRYKDINGDNVIDERDIVKIGQRTYPKMHYALHLEAGYAGFDFRALLQGVTGREVNLVNSAYNKTRAFENYRTVYEIAKGRWAYYPEQGIDTRATATFPRLTTQFNENNYRGSTFWMKNGDFLRLRNVEIGYTLPKRLLNQWNMANVRLFVSGINLFTLSSLLKDYDLDPETLSGHPGIKSYNAGISIGF
ncbi:SusC/RagA family TonB-linked outer membrane protein [Bacteroidia bacterium]|nr:SusC/RagA family TonB-linked outer membrane protein [Bacteroidia bacterium]